MNDTASNAVAASPACHATRWRVATLACLIVLALVWATGMSMKAQFEAQLAHLQKKLTTTAQIRYVSVMLDDTHQPAVLLTFDPQDRAVQVQRLNDITEGREDSLQLWALDDSDRPLPLGVLTAKIKTVQVPVSEGILAQAKSLAISVENKGGAQVGQAPRLPYLYTGAVVKKAL